MLVVDVELNDHPPGAVAALTAPTRAASSACGVTRPRAPRAPQGDTFAMTLPDLASSIPLAPLGVREAKAEVDDDIFWSVTTILDVLNKPNLIPWAVGVTADRTVDRLDIVNDRLAREGRDSAVDYVKRLRWDNGGLLSDAALGTVAHALFNDYAVTEQRPEITPELHPDFIGKGSVLADDDMRSLSGMLHQYELFLERFAPQYEACEVCVYHPSYGYAGQLDGIFVVDGMRLIFDYKTSRKSYDAKGKETHPWPEAGLQLAAYRHATHAAIWRARRYENRSRRYYLLSPSEKAAAVAVPTVEAGVVVYVTPHRFDVYPARCGEREHDAFLYCLEAARWQFNDAKNVIGNPMIPTAPAVDLGDPFAGLPTY